MDRLNIAICDDSTMELETIKCFCDSILSKYGCNYKIDIYSNGVALLSSNIRYHLLLLDIQMEEFDGIQIKNILEKQCDTKIIFISNYEDRVLDAFGCNVFAYVNKRNLNSLEYALNKYLTEWTDRSYILINNKQIKLSDLIYIKGDGSYSVLHFINREYVQRKNLKDYLETLNNKGFIRIQKSYVINLKHVLSVNTNDVELTNSIRLKIKRGFQDNIKQAHLDYLRNIVY